MQPIMKLCVPTPSWDVPSPAVVPYCIGDHQSSFNFPLFFHQQTYFPKHSPTPPLTSTNSPTLPSLLYRLTSAIPLFLLLFSHLLLCARSTHSPVTYRLICITLCPSPPPPATCSSVHSVVWVCPRNATSRSDSSSNRRSFSSAR